MTQEVIIMGYVWDVVKPLGIAFVVLVVGNLLVGDIHQDSPWLYWFIWGAAAIAIPGGWAVRWERNKRKAQREECLDEQAKERRQARPRRRKMR